MPNPTPSPSPLEQIGPYKPLELLGEGGMGEVWLAQQSSPVKRKVALKIIKLGMDTHQVVARFEAERQALAVMDHPNIASVYDGGATETGRPFFVMELVHGVPITEYADTHKLAIRERIELFIHVCRAVQHAHHKGVIHRDLKPSNVLVTVKDGEAVPKVIDFGIAKAVGQELTEKTLHTQLGQMVGTPEYMSPEQAEMTGLDIDARTDIYSLGVMLYELLVGVLPFDLQAKNPFAQRAAIREQEISRPSARLKTLNTQLPVAQARSTTPRELITNLSGDLDWIVLRATEKDRTRRYETANGLALDLRRYLLDEPVQARPPSAAYRARKFVRRNRVGVFAAGLTLVALLTGTIGTSLGMLRAIRAEARAEQEAATSAQVVEFLVGLFEANDPSQAQGAEVTAREILERGAERLEGDLIDQPLVRAQLLNTMGRVFQSLGLLESAEVFHLKALELRRATIDNRGLEVAKSLFAVGSVRTDIGDYEGAESALREALEIREEALGRNHLDVARTIARLGWLAYQRGNLEEAEALLLEALPVIEASPGSDSLMAFPLTSLGAVYWTQGDLTAAEPLLLEALELNEGLNGRLSMDYVGGVNNLGILYYSLERYDDAETYYLESVSVGRQILDSGHPILQTALSNLGELYWRLGRLDEAQEYAESALAMSEQVLAPESLDLAFYASVLGRIYADKGEWSMAEQNLIRALRIQEAALDLDHPDLRETLAAYAGVLDATDRSDEATRVRAQVGQQQSN